MTGTDQGGSALRPDNTPGIRCSPSRPPVLHTASGTASLATGAATQAARHRARRWAGLCCGSDSRQRTHRRLRVGEFRWSASALLPNRLELCAAVDTSVNYYSHLAARPLNQNSIQRPQSVQLSQYRDTIPELAVAARPGVASPRVHTCRKTPPQAVVRHHAMARTVRAARRFLPRRPGPIRPNVETVTADTAWYAVLSRGSGTPVLGCAARPRCASTHPCTIGFRWNQHGPMR
jgi:hypothetical protein